MNKHGNTNWQEWAERASAEATAKATLQPWCIALLPHHGIDLFCVDGDGQRFARLFRQVWSKLPAPARDKLLKHWGKKQVFADLFSEVGPWRCGFTCDVVWMDGLSDDVVEAVAAHNLACAVCTIDDPDRYAAACGDRGSRRLEHAADALAESWGFDIAAAKRACCQDATEVDTESSSLQASGVEEVR